MTNTITLGDILTGAEIDDLVAFISLNKTNAEEQGLKPPTTKNLIMKWLDDNDRVRTIFAEKGILKSYGAYAIQYMLSIP